MDLYSAFIVVPHTQGVQVRITQCYLQITAYLPLFRKRSPDDASPDWRLRTSNCSLLLIYLPRNVTEGHSSKQVSKFIKRHGRERIRGSKGLVLALGTMALALALRVEVLALRCAPWPHYRYEWTACVELATLPGWRRWGCRRRPRCRTTRQSRADRLA